MNPVTNTISHSVKPLSLSKHVKNRRSPLATAIISASLLSTIGFAPTPAFAQSDRNTAKKEVKKLSPVVVTSQKREEKIQDVPVPITAISGAIIQDKQIASSTDVERLAPNLSGQGTSAAKTGKPRWFLRGIGTNDPNQNQDGPLSIYVDEVVIGLQSLQSFPLFDLERVEVLRGPQGTLWGKNNTGGALHFISKAPSFDTSGYAKVGYGRYGNRTTEGAVGGALIEEKLAGRVSINYEEQDGWAKNITNNEDGPQFKDFSTRYQLLANITDNFDAQLILTTRDVDQSNTPSYVVGGTNPAGTDITIPNPNGIITQGQTPAQIAAGGGYIPPYRANPTPTSDFWDGEGYNRGDRNGATLKLNWQLGNNTLTSISGWSESDGSTLSLVGVPLNTTLTRSSSTGETTSDQVSQEIRLTSPKDQTLSWILGAYYYKLNATNDSRSVRFANGGAASIALNREQYSESSWDQDSKSVALFGNTRYQFNEKASLSLGARITRENKEITETSLTVSDTAVNTGIVQFVSESAWYAPGGVIGTGNFTPLEISKDKRWTRFTWDITPEYRISDDILGYARIATGFRSGGFNQSITNGDIIETDPEILTDYELGFKSNWLDGRVTFNTAVFYYDLENIQLNIQRNFTNTTTGVTTSSASGQSDGNVKGIEFEVAALPLENWNISGSLGYLKSEYTDFEYFIGGAGPFDASGNEFYRTPRTSFRIDTDYSIDIGVGKVVLGTDWSYRSKVYHNATVQNDPYQETEAYWIGNARVSYVAPNNKWRLTAYINNITDEDSAYLRQIVNRTNGTFSSSFSPPQTYGVQATLNF